MVIEYAAGDPTQPSPRLYVPVTEAHLVSKYVGAGKARPMLNTFGGIRWAKAKAQAEEAVRPTEEAESPVRVNPDIDFAAYHAVNFEFGIWPWILSSLVRQAAIRVASSLPET